MQSIILASQSPRRKQLLETAEIPFHVIVKSTDESYPPGLAIEEIPVHIARQKAIAVKEFIHFKNLDEHKERCILAADTVVVLNNTIIGKPATRADAINTLLSLSGRTHKVITGVVVHEGDNEVAFSETTEVAFYELSREQVEFYVDKFQPFDKAGAYAIQEWIGVVGISAINGDFYNVMGLPVSRVLLELRKICK